MNPYKENYSNLTLLWHLYGAKALSPQLPHIFLNVSWPKRCWLTNSDALNNSESREICLERLKDIEPNTTFSIFNNKRLISSATNQEFESIILNSNFKNTFNQMAMYLEISKWNPTTNTTLTTHEVATTQNINDWVSIGSDAFGYEIDQAIIKNIRKNKNIKILLASYEGKPAASALVFKTNKTMGIHQVAVKSSLQGRGIARQLMNFLLTASKAQDIEIVVLQASDAGKPLYDSLGFVDLFEIKNYQNI